jgi:hypothetical protein
MVTMLGSSAGLAKLVSKIFSNKGIRLETVSFHWRQNFLWAGQSMPEPLTYRIRYESQSNGLIIYTERVMPRHLVETEVVGSRALGLDMKRNIFDFMRKDFALMPPADQDMSEHWRSAHGLVLPVKLGLEPEDKSWMRDLLRC